MRGTRGASGLCEHSAPAAGRWEATVQAASGQSSTGAPATVPTDTARQNRLGHALQAFLTEYNGETGTSGAQRASGQILSQLLPPGARPWAAPRAPKSPSPGVAPSAQRKPLPSRSAGRPPAVATVPPRASAPAKPPPRASAGAEVCRTVAPGRDDPPPLSQALAAATARMRPETAERAGGVPAGPVLDLTPGALRYHPYAPREAPKSGAARPAPTPSPGLAPASALEPATSRHLPSRAAAAAAGGLGMAVALVAALAWGAGTNGTLSQRTQQLAATKADVTALQQQLAGVEQHANALGATLRMAQQQHQATQARFAVAEEELHAANGRLALVLHTMARAEQQLSLTKSQLGQVRDRLGRAQTDLSASKREASQCREAAALGQQDTQLLSSFIQLESVFLAAGQTKGQAKAQTDVSQMESLSQQSQAIGPRFLAALNRCTAL